MEREVVTYIVTTLTNFCIRFRVREFYCLLTDFCHLDFSTCILCILLSLTVHLGSLVEYLELIPHRCILRTFSADRI